MSRSLTPDRRDEEIPPRLRAIFEYAEKLTKSPSEVGREDIERLHSAGLDDRAILDLAQIVSYFNFVNRMAEGLGVEIEG